jgi:cell division initiation protein
MSIIPIEITSKEFHKSMRGYDPAEVREYLEEVSRELGRLMQEKAALAGELEAVKNNLARYHDLEDKIKDALLLAQQTKEEVLETAKKQAALIVEEARFQGKKIEDGYSKVKSAKHEFEIEFEALLGAFKGRLKALREPEDKNEIQDGD